MQPQDPNQPQPVMDVQSPPKQQNPSSNDVPTLPASMTFVKPKRQLPLLPILTAVVVAIAVIGLSAFAFIESKHNKKAQQASQSAVKKDQPKNRVTTDDVDKVKDQIDQNMTSIVDSTDFTSDDLSSKKMGGL